MVFPSTIYGAPLDQSALVPIQAFAQAISEGDENGARAECTPNSWECPGDSPGRLFAQCVRKGLVLVPGIIGRLRSERASARVFLQEEGRDERIHDLFLLLTRESGSWRIAAPTTSRNTVGLFLRGDLAVPTLVADLPPSKSVAEWAESALQTPLGELAEFAAKGDGIRLTHATTLAGRGAACFQVDTPERPVPIQAWVLLEQDDHASWHPRRWSRSLSLEAFLDGLDIPWDATEHDKERAMSDDTAGNDTTTGPESEEGNRQKANVPPEKAAEMIQAFGELVKGMAQARERGEIETPTIQVKPGEGGKLPEAMLNLFSAAIQQAQANQGTAPSSGPSAAAPAPPVTASRPTPDDNVVNLDQEREKREKREPSELEMKVQSTVKTAFTDYMAKNVATDGNPDVNVDGEFLQQHGPAVMGAVMQSLASVLIPDKLEFSVPAENTGDDGAEPRKVNLKVDLAGMLNSLKPKNAPPKEGD